MRDSTTTQCVQFDGVFRKPVDARFDQAHASSDGGAHCYLPLLAFLTFNGEPDQPMVAAMLRPGNAVLERLAGPFMTTAIASRRTTASARGLPGSSEPSRCSARSDVRTALPSSSGSARA